MPFPVQAYRPFTATAIQRLEPGQFGCYGIYSGRTCLYVGKGDVRAQLIAHLNGDVPCILRGHPTHWYAIVTDDSDSEHRRLVAEQRPICHS